MPQNHQKTAVAVIKKFGKVSGERKVENGTSYNISCVPGDMNSLISELNAATKGMDSPHFSIFVSFLGECDIQFEVEGATGQAEEAPQQGGRTPKSQANKRGGGKK